MKTVYHSFADKIITLSAINEPEEGCDLIRNLIVSDLIKSGKDIMEINRLIRTFDKRYCEDLIVSLLAKADRSGENAAPLAPDVAPSNPTESGARIINVAATGATDSSGAKPHVGANQPDSYRANQVAPEMAPLAPEHDIIEQNQPLIKNKTDIDMNQHETKPSGASGGYIDSISNSSLISDSSLTQCSRHWRHSLRSVSPDGNRYKDQRVYNREAVAFGNEAQQAMSATNTTCVDLEQYSVPDERDEYEYEDEYLVQEDPETVADEDSCDEGVDDGCLGDSIVRGASHDPAATNGASNAAYLGCLDPAKLLSINLNVWFNQNRTGGSRSKWSIKLESSGTPDPAMAHTRDPLSVHYLHFADSPRRFKQNLTKMVSKNRMAHDEAEAIKAQIDEDDEIQQDTKVALLSQQVNGKFVTVAKGDSQLEKRYFPGYWATLSVNKSNEPVKLVLRFGVDTKPIVIDHFRTVAKIRDDLGRPVTNKNAPTWLARYDPQRTQGQIKMAEKAMRYHQQQQKKLADLNPANALARYVSAFYADLYSENLSLKSQINELRNELDDLREIVMRLAPC